MANYLLDTNILIDLVLHKKTASFFSNLNAKQPIFYTSLICISEFIAGANSTENRALVKWVETQQLKTLGFETLADAQLAADLRKKTKLKLPPAITYHSANPARLRQNAPRRRCVHDA